MTRHCDIVELGRLQLFKKNSNIQNELAKLHQNDTTILIETKFNLMTRNYDQGSNFKSYNSKQFFQI